MRAWTKDGETILKLQEKYEEVDDKPKPVVPRIFRAYTPPQDPVYVLPAHRAENPGHVLGPFCYGCRKRDLEGNFHHPRLINLRMLASNTPFTLHFCPGCPTVVFKLKKDDDE